MKISPLSRGAGVATVKSKLFSTRLDTTRDHFHDDILQRVVETSPTSRCAESIEYSGQ